MTLGSAGCGYPGLEIVIGPFPDEFARLFAKPVGFVEDEWPPVQVTYLVAYLEKLGCKTVVTESHYIDRDFIADLSLFYARSLRPYPNYCQRVHFFRESFDEERWRGLINEANKGRHDAVQDWLQGGYLGFSVVRPLPGSPVGRTVLATFGRVADDGHRRLFGAVHPYRAHLAGFDLEVEGLPFQQQDQGVSACATTALWCALHQATQIEGLALPTPAEITEAASRYRLDGGRALPSEGLTLHQVCEATRAAGLAPLLIQGVSLDHDRAQLLAYIRSGFAPVLAIRPITGEEGHAVCAVGVRLGEVAPQADPDLHHRDAASAVGGVYIHDDRLGPYASAELYSYTVASARIRTALNIRWPGEPVEAEHSVLQALVVPVPTKLRLTVARMRALGYHVAEVVGLLMEGEFGRTITLDCRYERGTVYRQAAFGFGLSNEGVYDLTCKTVLSRYVGVIEISVPAGPVLDVVLDATETRANPSVLACIGRALLPAAGASKLQVVAENLGVSLIR